MQSLLVTAKKLKRFSPKKKVAKRMKLEYLKPLLKQICELRNH